MGAVSRAVESGVRPGWTVSVTHSEADLTAGGPLAALDDRALAAAAAAGSREAFDAIVERHQRAIYLLCYRFVGRHEEASDLAQDVFLRAYRGLARFKGDSAFKTWLYRIGINVCLNRVSSRAPAGEPLDDAHPLRDPGPDPAALLLEAERAGRVRAAIAELPPKQRAALVLRIYHDLSHQEIAAIIGGTEGAVKANFFHALQNLKRILGAERPPLEAGTDVRSRSRRRG